jgi:hypothetical protein
MVSRVLQEKLEGVGAGFLAKIREQRDVPSDDGLECRT